MTDGVKRRAFEPFYTTKGEAGTGLGLSQVYAFMDQLSGRISIDSQPGEGCAVHLYFPATGRRLQEP
jgi:signal transduction histidine kinase